MAAPGGRAPQPTRTEPGLQACSAPGVVPGRPAPAGRGPLSVRTARRLRQARSPCQGAVVGTPVYTVAILTVSDRSSRGEREDRSGPAVCQTLAALPGAHVVAQAVVPDEIPLIVAALRRYVAQGVDLVLTTGGTGFSPRDVTPEATRQVVERETPGLAEAMRAAGLAHTPHAMLSRAVAGIAGRTLIVNLPGSPRAARENLEALLPALPHGLAKLQGDPAECGAVDPA